VYVLLCTYTALRLSQICGGLCQTRKTPTLDGARRGLKFTKIHKKISVFAENFSVFAESVSVFAENVSAYARRC
jgi:hypothetical protein